MTSESIRAWVATVAVILVLIAVWKFIDWRMRPPPSPHPIVVPTPPVR